MSGISVGQRWLSESEPELGLGRIKEVTARQIVMWFDGGELERRYVKGNAPLRRICFRPGDIVEAIDGSTFLVESVEERDGLYFYHGEGDSLCEILLSHHMRLDAPEERLSFGQWSPPRQFDLRHDVLRLRSEWMTSPVRGMIGARADLLPHQLFIAHAAAQRQQPRLLLADETGLGKTIEAGLIIHQLRQTYRAQRILILLPEPLLNQWFVEMLRRFHQIFRVIDETYCRDVAASSPDGNPFADDQLCICSLEWLAANRHRTQQALSQSWDVLVCDEAHHIEANTPPYQLVSLLAQQAWGVLLLTATPEQLGPQNHFARLQILDPARYTDAEAFLHDHQRYQDLAALASTLLDTTQPLSPQVQERLQQAEPELLEQFQEALTQPLEERQETVDTLLDRYGLGRVMFRNTRERIKGFPERIVKLYPLTAKVPKARASAKAPTLDADPRLAWLLQWLQTMLDTQQIKEKVLLIATTQSTIVELHQALQEQTGINIALFHEGLSLLQRDRNAVYFADPDGANLMLCSALGGEGRNFQAARHLLLFDLPDQPEQLDQRIGRLDRIGQGPSIELHIPYLQQSTQEVQARWYNEGLNAFAEPCIGGYQTYLHMRERLDACTSSFWLSAKQSKELDALLADTAAYHAAQAQTLATGRDKLLELSSFVPEQGESLRNAVESIHQNYRNQEIIWSLFEHFGVENEPISEEAWKLQPGVRLHEGFPWLRGDAMQVTFDRDFALTHPTTQFISLEHPMVVGAFELLLGSQDGNCCIGVDPDAKTQAIWLEALFVWECTAPHRLNIERFFPPTPVRIVVDHELKTVEKTLSAKEIAALQPASKRWLGHKSMFQELVPSMLQQCRKLAEAQRTYRLRVFQQRAEGALSPELTRLRFLSRHNPDVSQEEIAMAEAELAQIKDHIAEGHLRLDALRLILRGVSQPK